MGGEPEDVHEVRDVELPGGIPARSYRPAADDLVTVVYLRRRLDVGSLNSFDRVSRSLANASGAEVPHSSAAWRPSIRSRPRWTTPSPRCAGRPSRPWVAVAGDSAGGNLATGAARLAGVPLRGQLLNTTRRWTRPWTARATRSSAARTTAWPAARGAVLGVLPRRRRPRRSRRQPDGRPPVDCAPCRRRWSSPRSTTRCATSEAYARRMRDAGSRWSSNRCGLVHGFFRWAGRGGRAADDRPLREVAHGSVRSGLGRR